MRALAGCALSLLAALAPAQSTWLDRTYLARPIVRVAIDMADAGATVNVHIAGKGPFRFHVDPSDREDGAIDATLARRLRLLSRRDAVRTHVPALQLGRATVSGLDMRVADFRDAPHRGVLGLRALRDVLLHMDPQGAVATLYRGELGDRSQPLADGDRVPDLTQLGTRTLTLDQRTRRMLLRPKAAARASGPARFAPDASPMLETRRTSSGHLLVRPLVNGQELGWFVFDTGATSSTISQRRARAAGLEAVGNGETVTQTRIHRTTIWRTSALQIGPLTVANVDLMGMNIDSMARAVGDVVGILGGNVLTHGVVEFDNRTDSVALHDPARGRFPGLAWVPFELSKRVPLVDARFESHEGRFLLDTGDPGAITLYAPTVQRLNLLDGRDGLVTEQHGEVGGLFELQRGTLESFVLGGHRFISPPVSFATTMAGVLGSNLAAGNLGCGMLDPYAVILDYPRKRIAFLRRDPFELSPDDLDRRAGTYGNTIGTEVVIHRDRERLLMRFEPGGPEHEMIAETATTFYLRYGRGECRFVTNRAGDPTSIILTRPRRPTARLRRAAVTGR